MGRQDITAAAVRACKSAISSNSIPAFRTGMEFSPEGLEIEFFTAEDRSHFFEDMISTECCTSGFMSRDSHEFDMAFSFGRCTAWSQLSTNEIEGKVGSTSFCTKWP